MMNLKQARMLNQKAYNALLMHPVSGQKLIVDQTRFYSNGKSQNQSQSKQGETFKFPAFSRGATAMGIIIGASTVGYCMNANKEDAIADRSIDGHSDASKD